MNNVDIFSFYTEASQYFNEAEGKGEKIKMQTKQYSSK